jgi:hypothetical protein
MFEHEYNEDFKHYNIDLTERTSYYRQENN